MNSSAFASPKTTAAVTPAAARVTPPEKAPIMAILQELKELDISNMTPLEGLNTLYRLQNLLKNRWQMPGS